MRNLEWKFAFGKPIGYAAADYEDPNELRRLRIEEKAARLKTLRILCTMKGKSVCGMRAGVAAWVAVDGEASPP